MPLTVPDQTIPAQVKVPDMMNTLNSIMNFKNNKLKYEADTANLGEKTALRDLVNDQSVQNPDGSLNQDKFTAKAQIAAPTLGAGVAQGNLNNQSTQIANTTNRFALNKDYANTALQTATGLLQDPRISANSQNYNDKDAADALSEGFQQMLAKGVPLNEGLIAVAPYMNAVHTPGAVAQMLKNTLKGQMSAQGQVGAMQPTLVNNGQQQVNVNPVADPVSIQNQLPPSTPTVNGNTPGYLGPQPSQDPSEQGPQGLDLSKLSPVEQQALAKTDPQAFANGAAHFQQTQGNSQVKNPSFVSSGLPADAQELMQARAAANQAAVGVGDSRSNNAQIREILKDTSSNFLDPTGKAASNLQALSSKMGFAIGGDAASNYNSIAHNLALQQQTRNQQMGVKTDAGSAISGVSSGSPDQDRKTLMRAVNISDAGNIGIEMFNKGMESAIKTGGIPAIRDFKNAWSSNYDVNALRLVNANTVGDKEEAQSVIKLMGGTNSPAFKAARQKIQNLEKLSQGILP